MCQISQCFVFNVISGQHCLRKQTMKCIKNTVCHPKVKGWHANKIQHRIDWWFTTQTNSRKQFNLSYQCFVMRFVYNRYVCSTAGKQDFFSFYFLLFFIWKSNSSTIHGNNPVIHVVNTYCPTALSNHNIFSQLNTRVLKLNTFQTATTQLSPPLF